MNEWLNGTRVRDRYFPNGQQTQLRHALRCALEQHTKETKQYAHSEQTRGFHKSLVIYTRGENMRAFAAKGRWGAE